MLSKPDARSELRNLYTRPRGDPHLRFAGEHGKRDTWDVRGEAVCPTYNTRWRSTLHNTFEIVASTGR